MKSVKKLSKSGKELREILITHAEMLLKENIKDPKIIAGSFLTLMAGTSSLNVKVHDDFAQAGFITSRDNLSIGNKKIIHINRNTINSNTKNGTNDPPIIVRQGRKRLGHAHELIIDGPCKIVYSPHKPLDCGARLWIETDAEVSGYDNL